MDLILSALYVGFLGLVLYLSIALLTILVLVLFVVISSLVIYATSPSDKKLENVYRFIDYAVERLEKNDKTSQNRKPIKFLDD